MTLPFMMTTWIVTILLFAIGICALILAYRTIARFNAQMAIYTTPNSPVDVASAPTFPFMRVFVLGLIALTAIIAALSFQVWAPRATVSAGPNTANIIEQNRTRQAAPIVESAPVYDPAAAAAEREALSNAQRERFESLPDDTAPVE